MWDDEWAQQQDEMMRAQDEFETILRSPLYSWLEQFIPKSDSETVELSHYTTLDGLMGVMTSGCIFASDLRFMNDPTEFTYGRDLLVEQWRQLQCGTCSNAPSVVVRVAEAALESLSGTSFPFTTFVACFTEAPDSLSHWRGYGGVDGVSISLDLDIREFNSIGRRETLSSCNALAPEVTLLRPVLYDRTEQGFMLEEVLKVWVNAASAADSSYFGGGPGTDELLFASFIETVSPVISFLKSPDYADEREWRLVKIVDVQRVLEHTEAVARRRSGISHDGLQVLRKQDLVSRGRVCIELDEPPNVDLLFRTTRRGIVPYVKVPLVSAQGGTPVPRIKRVTLSPTFAGTGDDLVVPLRAHRQWDVPVMGSKVPYRD
jgi:hypothetical protein